MAPLEEPPETAALACQVRALPEPGNYFAGVPGAAAAGLPRNVLLFSRCAPFEEKPTVHPRCMLVLCLEGPGGIIVDGRIFQLEPGHGLLVLQHQCHHYLRFREPRLAWLFVTFELEEAEGLQALRGAPFRLSEAGRGHLGRIVECYRAWLAGDDALAGDIVHWLALLLSRLLRERAAGIPSRHPPATGESTFALDVVRRAARFVSANIHRPLTLAEIAGHVAVSESHLRRLFRQTVSTSLGAFIQETRAHKACGLLHGSRLNITEIAEACGYGSVFAFSRAFRRQMGVSPLQYRRMDHLT